MKAYLLQYDETGNLNTQNLKNIKENIDRLWQQSKSFNGRRKSSQNVEDISFYIINWFAAHSKFAANNIS